MKTHLDIIKSSAWIGGSQGLVLIFTLLRLKVFAVVLGKEGVGVMAFFTNVWELGFLIGGLGISQSGVRFIAEARSRGDMAAVRHTTRIIRNIVLGSGLFTLLVFLLFRSQLSEITFDSSDQAVAIAILGLGVLFQIFAEGEKSVILGFREVKKVAFGNGYGIISGTLIGILLVILFKESALVWVLVVTGLTSWLAMRWQRRKIATHDSDLEESTLSANTPNTQPSPAHEAAPSTHGSRLSAFPLIQLGLVLVASSVLSSLVFFLTKTWILSAADSPEIGNGAVGLFEQSYRVTAFYVNFVLGAMAADFLPRLTETIKDKTRCIATVNEQIEVGVLLVLPGIVGLILFRELVLLVLASEEFVEAGDLVIWFAVGCLGRVMTWPVAYLFVAAEKKITFFSIEFCTTLIHGATAWYLVSKWGGAGGAAAFAVIYCFYGVFVSLIAHRMFGFVPDRAVTGIAASGLLFTGLAVAISKFIPLPEVVRWVAAVILLLGVSFYSIHSLVRLLPDSHRWKSKLSKLAFLKSSLK